jgi:CubicO group peptidase (beta-lactamase class C family)
MPSAYLDHVQTTDSAAGQVDYTMKSFAAQGFSGTVLIDEGSRVLLYKGYGQANRARELPNTAETRYPLGAVENVFTAAAMLRLEEEGKISTQDLVSRFVPAPADLRIDDLLRRNREVTAVAYAGGMASTTGPADPLAERFAETGASYVTLRRVLEQVTGESYEDYLTNHLLTPSGLTRTFWDNGTVGDSLVARLSGPLGER